MQPDAFDRFLTALRSGGQRRISLDRLRTEFARACPELAEQADRRDHLARLIQNAATRGALNLPRSSTAWDRAGAAALPRFVVLTVPPARRAATIPGYAWHPLLAFAAQERNTRRLATLRLVNEWLKADPDLSYTVPIKERSLDIFGDEKRLDQLRTSNTHFFHGKLALTALACRICPTPLPCEEGPPEARGCPILIIENNDTWASFCAWNLEPNVGDVVGHRKELERIHAVGNDRIRYASRGSCHQSSSRRLNRLIRKSINARTEGRRPRREANTAWMISGRGAHCGTSCTSSPRAK